MVPCIRALYCHNLSSSSCLFVPQAVLVQEQCCSDALLCMSSLKLVSGNSRHWWRVQWRDERMKGIAYHMSALPIETWQWQLANSKCDTKMVIFLISFWTGQPREKRITVEDWFSLDRNIRKQNRPKMNMEIEIQAGLYSPVSYTHLTLPTKRIV